MPTATPADVLARRRQLMLSGDADGFADLFAPDALIEFCFHGSPGTPVRLEGQEAIREYSRQVMASPIRIEEFDATELYQTQDPEVVVAEMRTKATLTATGRSITAVSIQVLRIQDGHIVLFRDFADPRIFEDLAGELGLGSLRAMGGSRGRRAGRRARGRAQQRGRVLAAGYAAAGPARARRRL
jgi:uncharacterized protein